MVFVVDSSGSILDDAEPVKPGEKNNWELILSFLTGLIDSITIGEDLSHIGVILFSTSAESDIYMNEHYSKADLERAMLQLPYLGGHTNTSAGLDLLYKDQFRVARGDRADIPDVVIVLTDGVSTYSHDDTIPTADYVKSRGATIYSVGVTNRVSIYHVNLT